MPIGNLTFTRKCLNYHEFPDFQKSEKKFREVIIRQKGTIENCFRTLQVDDVLRILNSY